MVHQNARSNDARYRFQLPIPALRNATRQRLGRARAQRRRNNRRAGRCAAGRRGTAERKGNGRQSFSGRPGAAAWRRPDWINRADGTGWRRRDGAERSRAIDAPTAASKAFDRRDDDRFRAASTGSLLPTSANHTRIASEWTGYWGMLHLPMKALRLRRAVVCVKPGPPVKEIGVPGDRLRLRPPRRARSRRAVEG